MATKSKRHPRLLELIAIGDSKEEIDSLAMALKVSSKTVRRDLEDLRKLGFAIVERGEPQGAKTLWLDKKAISNLKLTYDEAFSLLLYRLGFDSNPTPTMSPAFANVKFAPLRAPRTGKSNGGFGSNS